MFGPPWRCDQQSGLGGGRGVPGVRSTKAESATGSRFAAQHDDTQARRDFGEHAGRKAAREQREVIVVVDGAQALLGVQRALGRRELGTAAVGSLDEEHRVTAVSHLAQDCG